MLGIHCTEMGLQSLKNWAAVFKYIAETFGVVVFYLYPPLACCVGLWYSKNVSQIYVVFG